MSLEIRLVAEAAAELEAAAQWYELRGDGLGAEFVAAVDQTLGHIASWLQAAPLVPGLPEDLPVRRAPIRRFPYHVAYLAVEARVIVLAVAHDHRAPDYWHPRVSPPV